MIGRYSFFRQIEIHLLREGAMFIVAKESQKKLGV